MKNLLVFLFVISTGLIFGQTNVYSPSVFPPIPPRDGKIPPPLNLGAAYDKAVLKLGADTNQFHCVSATCLLRLTHIASSEDPSGSSFGWTFVFLDTNGVQKNVYVYFNKASTVWIEDPNRKGF